MTVSQAPAPRPHSYYAATLHKDTNFPSLAGTITVDVAIIGGGFTGISTAVELAERGLKVAVLETHRIGWGASGRNGGQVTGSLSGDTAMRSQLREKLGNEVDDFIWSLRWRGQQIIEERVKRYAIKCDLKRGHIHAAMKPSHLPDLQALYDEAQVRGMGDQVTLLGPTEIREHLASDLYIGGLRNQRNLHIHPLNLCIGEAHAAASLGALIFEQSKVLEIVH
jgi:glycine/D-amino acid oxidase-like deaminating enzyme